jgi:hypothetical protein
MVTLNMLRIALCLTIFSFSLSPLAFATDAPKIPDIPKPLNVMPSKIKPVQDGEDELSKAAPEGRKLAPPTNSNELEILSPLPDYGFQSDFADNLSRSDINEFFSKPSKASLSAGARKLALKFALTSFSLMSNEDKFPENIYGLRLNTLLNLGAFSDAENLYKLNESAPPSPLAARAGIEALFASKQTGVACLDQKTFDENLKLDAPQFWSNVTVFCQSLLGPVAGDDDELRLSNASRAYLEIVKPVVTTAEDVNKLDTMTSIAMVKSGGLAQLISTADNLTQIDDKHLTIIYKFSHPTTPAFPVLAEGLKRGVISSDDALTFLKSVDVKTVPTPYADYLKEYFKTPDTPMVTDKLLEMSVNDFVKETLLYPLYTASEIAFPESHKILSLRLLALTNQDLPANLVRSAYVLDKILENETESGESTLIRILLDKTKSPDESPPNLTNLILLVLNYANYPQKDVKNAYDNILGLTASGNYVMHNGDILSSLKKSADKKLANQVVIRSLALIDDKPLDKLHPAELYQILEALNSAGLTEETILLTREVLGNIMKN